MKPGTANLVVGMVLHFLITGAAAAPITFEFAGNITSIAGADATVRYGGVTTFSGSFTFESTTPDAHPGNPSSGNYNITSPMAFSLALGSDLITSSSLASSLTAISIQNYSGVDPYWAYRLSSGYLDGVPGATYAKFHMNLGFETPFNSDALLTTPPDLAFATTNRIDFVYTTGAGGGNPLVGELTSLRTVSGVPAVPEPSSLVLLAIGLTSYFSSRRLPHRFRKRA